MPPPSEPVAHPFRNAVMRGLGLLVPPLLTVVILLWIIDTTRRYVLDPVNALAREALIWRLSDVREGLTPEPGTRTAYVDGQAYYRLDDHTFVPEEVYNDVRRSPGSESLPQTVKAVYGRYMELKYLRPYYVIPLFLAVFILLLYLLGRFMAFGLGRFFWGLMEHGILRLPLVRSVYSAVKQVTDFFISKKEVEFKRVVAVEYPRAGMWCVAFVTSEGLPDVRAISEEPMLGIFLPTSPTSITGYALTVAKREVLDLNMTIDQAIQFVVSCGLVLPTKELERLRRDADEASNGSRTPELGSPNSEIRSQELGVRS
jgi:uncharacterized membrane protein